MYYIRGSIIGHKNSFEWEKLSKRKLSELSICDLQSISQFNQYLSNTPSCIICSIPELRGEGGGVGCVWSRLELVLLRAGGAYANALRLMPPRRQLTHFMQVLGKLGPI